MIHARIDEIVSRLEADVEDDEELQSEPTAIAKARRLPVRAYDHRSSSVILHFSTDGLTDAPGDLIEGCDP